MLGRAGKLMSAVSSGSLFGAGSAAGSLLGIEPAGMAVDFTSGASGNMLVRLNPANSLGNYSGTPFIRDGGDITFSRASLATVTDSDGKIKWAPHNLLLASEQFDASSWTKGAQVTLSANAAVAPNGTTTAERYSTSDGADSSLNNILQQVSTGPATVTAGVWLRSATPQTVKLAILDSTTIITNTSLSVTSTWTLFTISGTVTTGSATLWRLRPDGTNAISNLEIWGAHLYRSDLGGMQANTSAYPMYNPTTPKNLLGYSEAFDNAAWGKTASSITANDTIAPNGTTTAEKFTEDTTNDVHAVSQPVTVAASTNYSLSVYLKYIDRQYVTISFNRTSSSTVWASAIFDIQNGTVGGTNTNGGGAIVGTPTITSVGNGWYRCNVIASIGAVTDGQFYIAGATASTGASFRGSQTYVGTSKSFYIWGAQLSDSASLDPYVGSYGAAPSAAAYYGPRLDYDPVTLAAKGLLVEEQRTNLLTYSAAFDNAAWTKSSATIASSSVLAPDGVSTMSLLTPSSTISGAIYQAVTLAANTAYTISFFLKAGTSTRSRIGLYDVTGADFQGQLDITWTSGVPSQNSVTGSATNATFVNYGNGVWRVSITITSDATNTSHRVYLYPDRLNGNYTVYAWGAQVEVGAFATSYIPTAASSVTRSADVASVATSQFPYSASEYAVVVACASMVPTSATSSNRALRFSDGGTNDVVDIYLYQTAAGTLVKNANVTQADTSIGGSRPSTETVMKVASRVKANDFISAANGTLSSADTSGIVPAAATTLSIGVSGGLNGWVRQITYIPRALANSELQGRTI